MEKYLENYQTWLESDKIKDEEKAELQSIANNENEIKFLKELCD